MEKLTLDDFNIVSFVHSDKATRKRMLQYFTRAELCRLCKRLNIPSEGHSILLMNRLINIVT
jgi:hypothetical protein